MITCARGGVLGHNPENQATGAWFQVCHCKQQWESMEGWGGCWGQGGGSGWSGHSKTQVGVGVLSQNRLLKFLKTPICAIYIHENILMILS